VQTFDSALQLASCDEGLTQVHVDHRQTRRVPYAFASQPGLLVVRDGIRKTAGFKSTGLDLDVHHPASGAQVQRLFQSGQAFAGKARVEPAPGIQVFQLVQGEAANLAVTIGGPIEGIIVQHHGSAILCQG
jgi:hypothetical protein